ncbi:MAG TPA: pirin family protein, partial [Cyclobacteriaceae bacterium]|nr:pirin family protein [Cyclobacteriaceae bacterium]
QKSFKAEDRINALKTVVSPEKGSDALWINQDAWFSLGNLKKDIATEYKLKGKDSGVYAFVIEGDVTINNQKLNKRDGLGVWDIDKLSISADNDSEVLLIEVPMN